MNEVAVHVPMKRLHSAEAAAAAAGALVHLHNDEPVGVSGTSSSPSLGPLQPPGPPMALPKRRKISQPVTTESATIVTEGTVAIMASPDAVPRTNETSGMDAAMKRERERADHAEERYFDLLHRIKCVCSTTSDRDFQVFLSSSSASTSKFLKEISQLHTLLQHEMLACETLEQEKKYSQTHNQADTNMADSASDVVSPLNRQANKRSSYGYYCRPSRYISNQSREPLCILYANIKKQYTVSKRETRLMSASESESLVAVPVRVMGEPAPERLYIVAKDVCQLIHIRKANVARSIGQFSDREKARMSVLCKRSNKIDSTHVLIVLTLQGVHRLLTSSRSPLAPTVLKWLNFEIERILEAGKSGNTQAIHSNNKPIDIDSADVVVDQEEDDGPLDVEEDSDDHDERVPKKMSRQPSATPPPSHTPSNTNSVRPMPRNKSDDLLARAVRDQEASSSKQATTSSTPMPQLSAVETDSASPSPDSAVGLDGGSKGALTMLPPARSLPHAASRPPIHSAGSSAAAVRQPPTFFAPLQQMHRATQPVMAQLVTQSVVGRTSAFRPPVPSTNHGYSPLASQLMAQKMHIWQQHTQHAALPINQPFSHTPSPP